MVNASAETIKQRNVRLVISCNTQVFTQVECNVMPSFAPVDHVFRYYEPEHSYFKVRIPPFLQFNDQNMHVKVSRPTCQVDFDTKTSEINVQSKTGDAMNVVEATVFVYGDAFLSKLLATCRIEVTPLNCLYSQTKAGV